MATSTTQKTVIGSIIAAVIAIAGFFVIKEISNNPSPQVQQANPIAFITPIIYGFNAEVNYCRKSFNDTAFLKAIDSLHADAFRVPGGTYAEQYDYLVDTPSLYSVAMLKNYTHAKIILVLNTATSTLQKQLDFLKLAHNLNIIDDDSYIEIGNEYVEPHTDAFLNKCKLWTDTIAKYYPNIKFGIPGGAPRKWNAAVLAKIPKAYLVDHYHNPNTYTVNGITDTVSIGKQMDADLQYYFPNISHDKIIVTEFNLQIDDNSTPVFKDDEQKGIAVSYMFKKFRSYGFSVILFHNICMASGNGAIISEGKISYLSATGKGFISFKNSFK